MLGPQRGVTTREQKFLSVLLISHGLEVMTLSFAMLKRTTTVLSHSKFSTPMLLQFASQVAHLCKQLLTLVQMRGVLQVHSLTTNGMMLTK